MTVNHEVSYLRHREQQAGTGEVLTRRYRVRRQLGLEVLADVLNQATVPPQALGHLGLRDLVAFPLLFLLFFVFAGNEPVQLLGPHQRDKVCDENLFLVLVTTNEGDVFADGRVAGQVRVNLAEFDTEPTDLDLVVRPTRALDGAVRVVAAEISGAVHTVADSVPPRLPRRGHFRHLRDRVDALDPLSEPVVDKLLPGRVRKLQVALGETTRTDVDLSHLADSTDLVLVGAVDDEELHVDHALTGGHNVLARPEERRIFRQGRDREVRDGALRLGRAEHVDDAAVLRQLLQASAVPLREDVADKEGVPERGNEPRRLGREELTHCRSQMRHRNGLVGHPLGEATGRADVFSSRDVQARAEEQRSEDCSTERSAMRSFIGRGRVTYCHAESGRARFRSAW